MKFTEIFRLKKMLEEANIPFQFSENFNGGFHIVYSFEGKEICSVIEHEFSYGREKDLLEIRGLMTEQEMEETQDTVLGYLTADNVFGRIKMHWTSSKEADEFIKENSYITCENRVPGNPMSDSIAVRHELSAKMSFVEGFKRGQAQIKQLTEAKEIIKDLLDAQYRLDPYLEVFKARIKRAEDFISGVSY